LAAELQLESQKLLWRLRATSAGRDFNKKVRRTEGERLGFACRRRSGAVLRADWRGEPSILLIF
jgi:hypothetical protein